jgi:hypothetical protein
MVEVSSQIDTTIHEGSLIDINSKTIGGKYEWAEKLYHPI